jgi:hypothetical protein
MAWVNRQHGWLLVLLLLALPAWAESEAPTLELLEFLAEWQDEEGDWIDPVEFVGNGGMHESESNEESSDE